MLVVRSFIHVQAGFSGLRETQVDRAVELANRYANFGVISSFCARRRAAAVRDDDARST